MRALHDMEARVDDLFVDKNPTEALTILRQVLAGYEYLLGPDVDDVVAVVRTMGIVCMRLGNETEAETLLKRAVSGYETIHGLNDRRTLFCVADLAHLYKIQGRFEDSGVLLNRAAKGLEHTLPCSDMVLRVFSRLAWTYGIRGLTERACDWYIRTVAGYRGLGAGHEDTLLRAEMGLCFISAYNPDPALESLFIDVLAKCEARSGEHRGRLEDFFRILCGMCHRCYKLQDPGKFEFYNHRLRPIISRVFGKDTRASMLLCFEGALLADIYSKEGRYEEAESLFIRLKSNIEEEISLQVNGRGDALEISNKFVIVRIYAEHYIRQSMWEDAEPLLLKAKSLEKPFCRPVDSQLLVEALEKFRVGSGREAGALAHTQRTPGTHHHSSPHTPGQNVEDANTVISFGSAEFLQPLEEPDWSGFPLRSPSALSLHWSPQQPPSPTAVIQDGVMMEWENSGMMGMHDIVQ